MIRNFFGRMGLLAREEGPQVRVALDIGTEYVKAVYLELTDAGPKVLGVGRARQDYANMEVRRCRHWGVTALPGSAGSGCCDRWRERKDAVLGIAGQFVHGVSRTVERQRIAAEKPLSLGELRSHFQDAQRRP